MKWKLLPAFLTPALVLSAAAFDGHKVTNGPLALVIQPMATVTNFGRPQPVAVLLSNSAAADITAQLRLTGLVDECRPAGPVERTLRIPARQAATTQFQFLVGPGAHSAHYPLRVQASFDDGEDKRVAEAVTVFETDFSAEPKPLKAGESELAKVPRVGALALAALKSQQVAWSYLDKPVVRLPVGWQGTDAQSSASFSRAPVSRGESRQALQMHPPYKGGVGTVFAEYRLKLPPTQPLRLNFFNAIRDSSAAEGKSDGVTFRVWVGEEKLFERHTDAKVWTPGEADLGKFAGKEVILRLESHPGPKRNTSCDASYWGDPVVSAGEAPKPLSDEEHQRLVSRARTAATSGQAQAGSLFVFNLADGCRAAIGLGRHGLADGVVAFGDAQGVVSYDGLDISILDQPVGRWPSGLITEEVTVQPTAQGGQSIVQRLRMDEEVFHLAVELWKDQAGLRIKVSCPKHITALALGPCDQKAARVYYGHGYCIVDPEPFRISAGGHGLATSHVGFDFPNGVSLLQACDTPPDSLQVNPELRRYTLHTHPDSTFTFVPSRKGAFDSALKFRPLYDKKAAPAVARKAGRFVFDIWGGRYAEDAALMQRSFDYGVTDALLVMHVWQRWGYDYRLPDIYPPDPRFGTLEEMQALARLCASRDVPFALHDNFIDFYPDADEFSYEHITFDTSGRPRKAWIHQGRDAQSYQFRPDHIQPFVARNARLLQQNIRPTSTFVDVFASASSFDYYDRQGKLHSKLETREAWGKAFAHLRETFGGNAPTISEAGGDHLIGWLDGSDCQFLQLSPDSRMYRTKLLCKDWDRVPWFDAVNHTRFSLHGVGYSGRYQGGAARALRGIESDDYISAEILTGHALMTDLAAGVRGAVRKYWLAQDFIRSVALDEIAGVEFPENDIHRLAVTWKSGAQVFVNRREQDWTIAGHVLPQYGYFAKNGAIESSIERIGGAVVERSSNRDTFYVNGRGFMPGAPLRIRPTADRVEYLGNRQFKLLVNWQADESTTEDLQIHTQFYKVQTSRLVKTGWNGIGGKPSTPTTQWRGQVTTGSQWTQTIPADCTAGEYEILAGLHDPKIRGGRRFSLLGDEDDSKRMRIGTLVIEGKGTNVTGVSVLPPVPAPAIASRLHPNPAPVDFGLVQTKGALRCRLEGGSLVITPLPDSEPFELRVRPDSLNLRSPKTIYAEKLTEQASDRPQIPFTAKDGLIIFSTIRGDRSYRLTVE